MKVDALMGSGIIKLHVARDSIVRSCSVLIHEHDF